MTPLKKLDSLDLDILGELQLDASLPTADLAAKLRSSKSVIWRRIKEMVKAGVIRERIAIVEPRAVGLDVIVFVRIRMTGHGRDLLSHFTKTIQGFPEILECHYLLGDM